MNNTGWIKLHRKLLESEMWAKPSDWVKVWMYLLLKVDRDSGELKTSYSKIAAACNVTEGVVKRVLQTTRQTSDTSTLKVRHGVVIKLLNYAEYQGSENGQKSEKSPRDDLETSYKSPNVYKQEERIKNKEKELTNVSSKKISEKQTLRFSEDSEPYLLSELLLQKICAAHPKFKKPNLQKWAEDADKMMRLDARTPDEIEVLIHWVYQDPFWFKNVLSMRKLREKFDQLWVAASSDVQQRRANEIPTL